MCRIFVLLGLPVDRKPVRQVLFGPQHAESLGKFVSHIFICRLLSPTLI